LLKVFFGELMSREALLTQVRQRRAELEQLREDLEQFERAEAVSDRPDEFAALTRNYGLRYARALIEWADDVESQLAEPGPRSGRSDLLRGAADVELDA
jgi:hypothetical protein